MTRASDELKSPLNNALNNGSQVLPGQSVDSALDKNEPELGILVLPVPLQMLPDADSLLDQVVAILGQLGSHALALQDSEDLVASDESDLKMNNRF